MPLYTSPEPIVAWVDRDRIFQVLSNLIGNGLKFTPHGGIIRYLRRNRRATLKFQLPTMGLKSQNRTWGQIFERFSQLKINDRRGLGLYIAKWIVEAHHGRIWVLSEMGRGSTFTFTLPLCVSH
jgi:signal transduction histidine kinase